MQIILSGPLASLDSFGFENRILLKPTVGGVASVACFITGHEQTQSNQVCYFLFLGVFLASKGSNFPELIPASSTFFCEDLVMNIFLYPFFLFR